MTEIDTEDEDVGNGDGEPRPTKTTKRRPAQRTVATKRTDTRTPRSKTAPARTTTARVAPRARAAAPTPEPEAAKEPEATQALRLPPELTVRELGELLAVSPIAIIKALMKNGIMATISQRLDYDTAAVVAHDLGVEVHEEQTIADAVVEEEMTAPEPPPAEAPPLETSTRKSEPAIVEPAAESPVPEAPVVDIETAPVTDEMPDIVEPEDPEELLQPRPPVVTVMGHVDHGKTMLLDTIRSANVIATEAGGITQHIGAYQVDRNGHQVTFIDTPGHAAFTAMRARGARVTDIAIIVVSATEGVMPQTSEAIAHARAARVPIIVALNKMDLPEANPDRVKAQLAEAGLELVEWGGDVEVVEVSAKTGAGIDDLLETILLTAELAHDGKGFRANPNRPAVGTIIEARMDRQRGATATAIIQNGTLATGQYIVAGSVFGKVRALYNDRGILVKSVPPSAPVSVLGLADVPQAGDRMQVIATEKEARVVAAERALTKRTRELLPNQAAAALEDIFARMQQGAPKEVNLVLKADVQGSLEAVSGTLQNFDGKAAESSTPHLRIIHDAVGPITENDVLLAAASRAMVIGFNVTPDPAARRAAQAEQVEIRFYNIIYKLTEDVEALLRGQVEPVYHEVIYGHAEVRQVFTAGRVSIAGGYVTDGRILRNATIRVRRGADTVWTGAISSLKRFRDDVREVATGYEFGLTADGFNDFQEGDIIEAFGQERLT